MKALLNPYRVFAVATVFASTSIYADSEIDAYAESAREQQKKELAEHSELCSVLTAEACQMMEFVLSPNLKEQVLDGSDRLLLAQVMSLSPEALQNAEGAVENAARRKSVRNAGTTLGHSMGVAHESSRYNRLWEETAGLLDEAVPFHVLMMDSPYATNILPPVISQSIQYSATIEEGRTFRAAGKIYRIEKQPKFRRSAPTWRDYLKLQYKKPVMPPRSLLPANAQERDLFGVALIRGYIAGIETAKYRAKAAYNSLETDFNGMVLYHLLLSYEMVTRPIIDTNYNAVAVNALGNEMAIDDLIMRIKVLPRLEGNKNKWRALPILEEFEQSARRRHIRRRLALGSSS
jgi:defect-in-organelle-trafficking protein DotC